MMLKSRSEEILLATVAEYIESGEPVSSKLLFKQYNFGIRPASIRTELSTLESGGWLSQPYTSGGRVPTDRAYEFYIRRLQDRLDNHEPKPSRSLSELASVFLSGSLNDFVGGFADELHTLSIGFTEDGRSIKRGLDELFGRLEAEETGVFQEIAREFEALDERIEKYVGRKDVRQDDFQIFIGEKSPLIKNENLSTICAFYEIPSEQNFFLIAIQPKRANYEKNVRTFRGLKSALSAGKKLESGS
ncbi:MAG: hypothetical protein Q8P97_01150 [bacterium]|nr:hypothetical protein [bacterium]